MIINFCPHCMGEYEEGSSFCVYCGQALEHRNQPHQLPVNSILHGRYLVGAAIDQDSVSTSYTAISLDHKERLIIREYFPTKGLVKRKSAISLDLSPVDSESQARHRLGVEEFCRKGESFLLMGREEGLPMVRDLFRENNTAYMVMQYLQSEGLSLIYERMEQRIEKPAGSGPEGSGRSDRFSLRGGAKAPADKEAAQAAAKEAAKEAARQAAAKAAAKAAESGKGADGSKSEAIAAAIDARMAAASGAGGDKTINSTKFDKLRLGAIISGLSTGGTGRKKKLLLGSALAAAALLAVLLLTAFSPRAKFNRAQKSFDSGDYIRAMEILEGLEDWKKGEFQVYDLMHMSRFAYGEELMKAEEYEQALEIFEGTDAYYFPMHDRSRHLQACQDGITYQQALDAAASGDYSTAISLLLWLEDYKDSEMLLQKYNIMLGCNVGELVKFGYYEQDNDLSNGPEEIEWQVLEISGDKLLLISKYVLDAQAYHAEHEDVTWADCTLRQWLNYEFINKAFSPAHQALIEPMKLINHDHGVFGTEGGPDTVDKVFLLSINEMKSYFKNHEERTAQATEYAYDSGLTKSSSNATWWLRSPGEDNVSATIIWGGGGLGGVYYMSGTIYDFGFFVELDFYGVRPVICLNLAE